MRTVIHVACTDQVIGASLYAFVEFGQKRTVHISRVLSILHFVFEKPKSRQNALSYSKVLMIFSD